MQIPQENNKEYKDLGNLHEDVSRAAYILLGTNLGDRQLNLATAVALIAQQIGDVYAKSSVYETAAWGKTDQPGFLNQAIIVKSNATAVDVLNKMLAIEYKMDRVRLERWGERIIDLDLIFHGEEVLVTPTLTLPHPEMHNRKFVLVPLTEIAGNFIHPVLKKKVSELLFILNDDLPVHKI